MFENVGIEYGDARTSLAKLASLFAPSRTLDNALVYCRDKIFESKIAMYAEIADLFADKIVLAGDRILCLQRRLVMSAANDRFNFMLTYKTVNINTINTHSKVDGLTSILFLKVCKEVLSRYNTIVFDPYYGRALNNMWVELPRSLNRKKDILASIEKFKQIVGKVLDIPSNVEPILDWLAYLVQYPDQKPKKILRIKDRYGALIECFTEFLGKVFLEHFTYVSVVEKSIVSGFSVYDKCVNNIYNKNLKFAIGKKITLIEQRRRVSAKKLDDVSDDILQQDTIKVGNLSIKNITGFILLNEHNDTATDEVIYARIADISVANDEYFMNGYVHNMGIDPLDFYEYLHMHEIKEQYTISSAKKVKIYKAKAVPH